MTYITSVYKGQHAPNRALIRYNKLNPDRQIEYITPHTFRHTFCTNLMEKGIDIKYLQYLMGHSEASTTLDVYSHINYEHVFKQMKKVICLLHHEKTILCLLHHYYTILKAIYKELYRLM